MVIVSVIAFGYQRQSICVKRGKINSYYFSVSDGVRQGEVLSPKLFSLYINDLSLHILSNVNNPHLIFVLYLFSVTSQSLSLSRDSHDGLTGVVSPLIFTSRAASMHKNLHVKSPVQPDRVTRLMCVGRELD